MDNNNQNKVRRCGQIGEGEDDELSMQDVLDEQARLQADASAVLGASDPNNCTYPKGYLKRQALYACATCTPDGNAGICLACSYACHEGHDLYELYTKRFFCCDCGNDKFAGKECKLVKDKQMNSRNRYNQNFKGLYCSCTRPYPDPEDSTEDEMIQCITCEDWYHGRHLNTTVPEDFAEMICPECMSKFPFLWTYHISSPLEVVKKENLDASTSVNVEKMDPGSNEENAAIQETDMKPQEISSTSDKENSESVTKVTTDINRESHLNEETSKTTASCHIGDKRQRNPNGDDEEELIKPKVPKMSSSDLDVGSAECGVASGSCLLQSLRKREVEIFEHATFWSQGWRSKLCKCQDCMEMYKDKDIEYLIDDSDTVQAYEEAGATEEEEISEENVEANLFAGMHRVQQIELARGVRNLKTELNEFLQGFVREGKVVTEGDIREFFQGLEEKRRRNMNIPQNNCR